MNALEEKCKAKGVRLTDQRKIIAQVMSDSKIRYGAKDHPDVYELHKRVSEVDDKISIATVYRTLNLFEQYGLIKKLEIGEGKARYEEFKKANEHFHLVDIETGDIIEFKNKDLEQLKIKIAKELGYKLVNSKLELYGTSLKNK